MIGHSSPRSIMLAGAFVGVSLGISTLVASAQQAAQPLPPGSPLIGRPDNDAAQKLALDSDRCVQILREAGHLDTRSLCCVVDLIC